MENANYREENKKKNKMPQSEQVQNLLKTQRKGGKIDTPNIHT